MLFLIWLSLSVGSVAIVAADAGRLNLNVSSHRPCSPQRTAHEQLRFPDAASGRLVEQQGAPGCYVLRGPVHVYGQLPTNGLEVYLEYRHTLDAVTPEPCFEYKEDGCGGYGGSCVYCNGCDNRADFEGVVDLAKVSVTKDGESAGCDNAQLEEGVHEDIELRFCLPSAKRYIDQYPAHSQRLFDKLADHQNRLPLYIRLYVFDFAVHELMRQHRLAERQLRAARGLGDDEALPAVLYQTLPFARFLANDRLLRYIACQSVVASVSFE